MRVAAAVAGVLGPGDISGLVVARHRHAAVGPGHRNHLRDAADPARALDAAAVAAPPALALAGRGELDDADVVRAASGGHGPEEAAVWSERAPGGQDAQARQRSVQH